MVQSLIPTWKVHQEKTGIYESTMPPDSGIPLPEHVLRNLSADFVYFEKKFLEFDRDLLNLVSMFQETDAKDKDVPECTTRPYLMSKLDQDVDSERKPPCKGGGQISGTERCLNGSSQISGSDGKSRFTPLKSDWILGIDPLTSLESRGDLLPDAWFDAINIVALGFQNDGGTIIELLCGFKLLYPRSFDALLGAARDWSSVLVI
ncbi:DNA polymerase zeta catalytic subunit isoform X2 [Senna tora]|uniref:DNA polymerase zeta catalytic subunit isoform X2 n=1 Tax=Senna tora TaxID=362788 RepID=A0A834T9B7_9FABA|nr:DNA polymerase zeta catalytic subunit isoform X2 [Senna tora]